MRSNAPEVARIKKTVVGFALLTSLTTFSPAFSEEHENVVGTQAGSQRAFTTENAPGNTALAAQIIEQTGTVQCPIHLLQAAYDEATSGYQAASRYVTAIEVMHLCREHDELFRTVMDTERKLVESYAELTAARELIEAPAEIALPTTITASAAKTEGYNLLSLFSGNAKGDQATDVAEVALEETPIIEDVEELSCAQPHPASAYVLVGSTNSAGGNPRGIIGLINSHNLEGDYYEQTANVGAGDFLGGDVEVTEINVPWSDEDGEVSVVLTDCAGQHHLTLVSQMPSGHFVNPTVTFDNLQTGSMPQQDPTVPEQLVSE